MTVTHSVPISMETFVLKDFGLMPCSVSLLRCAKDDFFTQSKKHSHNVTS